MVNESDIEGFCETMLNEVLASWKADLLRVVERASYQGSAFYKIQSQEALSGYAADLVFIDDPYEGQA